MDKPVGKDLIYVHVVDRSRQLSYLRNSTTKSTQYEHMHPTMAKKPQHGGLFHTPDWDDDPDR